MNNMLAAIECSNNIEMVGFFVDGGCEGGGWAWCCRCRRR